MKSLYRELHFAFIFALYPYIHTFHSFPIDMRVLEKAPLQRGGFAYIERALQNLNTEGLCRALMGMHRGGFEKSQLLYTNTFQSFLLHI